MNTEEIVDTLRQANYMLDLTSQGRGGSSKPVKYCARFWKQGTQYRADWERSHTIDDVVRRAAIAICQHDGLDLGISKMDTKRAVEYLRQHGYLLDVSAKPPTGIEGAATYAAGFWCPHAPPLIPLNMLIRWMEPSA